VAQTVGVNDEEEELTDDVLVAGEMVGAK